MKILNCFTFALLLGAGSIANASVVSLAADGQWNEFAVDDFSAVSQGVEWIDANDSNSPDFGSALTYQFTIAKGFKGILSVVDGGFSGDRFTVFNHGVSIGSTSQSTNASDYSNDFENNLGNLNFSSGVFNLHEGTYEISGALLDTLQSFNATNGAIKLNVTSVPIPGTFSLLLSSLCMLMVARRRRV